CASISLKVADVRAWTSVRYQKGVAPRLEADRRRAKVVVARSQSLDMESPIGTGDCAGNERRILPAPYRDGRPRNRLLGCRVDDSAEHFTICGWRRGPRPGLGGVLGQDRTSGAKNESEYCEHNALHGTSSEVRMVVDKMRAGVKKNRAPFL